MTRPSQQSLDYIARHYGRRFAVGDRVTVFRRRGTVAGGRGPYVQVRVDGEPHALPYHPHDVLRDES